MLVNSNSALNFKFQYLNQKQFLNAILENVKILNTNLLKSGPVRLKDWKKGWGENLINFTKTNSRNDLIPKYFGKYEICRWKGRYVYPQTLKFEYNLLTLLIRSHIMFYIYTAIMYI